MRCCRWGIGIAAWLGVAGCAEPALDVASARPDLRLSFDPPSEPSQVPPVFRARVLDTPMGSEPWLLRGELSSQSERSLRNGELSPALRERAVPLRYWRDGSDCVVQPLVWLEPGERYVLALSGTGKAAELRVTDESLPRATRFFPASRSLPHHSSVLCGDWTDLSAASLTLEPGAVAAQATPGVFGSAMEGCLTLTAEQPLRDTVVAPPLWAGLLLEPSPFRPASAAPVAPISCETGWPVAGACLEVLDDRVVVQSAAGDSLWLLEQPASVRVVARAFERTNLLTGLEPDTSVELRGHWVTSAGSRGRLELELNTGSRRRHLVLNEVLADALGPEPQNEWIELVNDSEQAVELAGIWLEDATGRVPLPADRLEPGEIALLVIAPPRSSGLDVPFAENARVIALPQLSARGLANAGEALRLVGGEGVLSRFPMLPAKRAGKSVARRSLVAADDSAGSFAEHGAPGASPGAPNSFE